VVGMRLISDFQPPLTSPPYLTGRKLRHSDILDLASFKLFTAEIAEAAEILKYYLYQFLCVLGGLCG
jgi:hypothetical protein